MKPDDADYRHIEQTYDEGSEDYGGYFKQPHPFIEPERQQFIQRLAISSKILDCGCRPGLDTERFVRLGYRVTAIDLSDRFVNLTRKRVPGADVRKMDMRRLNFPAASFDGIWASFSLLHVRAADVVPTLSGFRFILRSSGLLFVALHRDPKTAWVKTMISGMERETYVQEWAQPDIESTLRASSFDILESRPFVREGGRYPLLGILAQS